MKKFTKVLSLVLVLALSLCMFTACGKSDEEFVREAIDGYMAAAKAADMKKAAEYCAGETYDAVIASAEEFTTGEYAEMLKEMMASIEYEINSVEVNEDTATVTYTVTAMNQDSESTLELEKIDGAWKIVGGV